MILASVGLVILAGCSDKPAPTAQLASFNDLNKEFKAADANTDVGYERKTAALDQIWTKYPGRRLEWIKPWLAVMDIDIQCRGLIYSKLQATKWDLEFSPADRIELGSVVGKAITIERTNLIQELCKLVEQKKLKVVLPELKIAAGSRKDGTNKKVLLETIDKLNALP